MSRTGGGFGWGSEVGAPRPTRASCPSCCGRTSQQRENSASPTLQRQHEGPRSPCAHLQVAAIRGPAGVLPRAGAGRTYDGCPELRSRPGLTQSCVRLRAAGTLWPELGSQRSASAPVRPRPASPGQWPAKPPRAQREAAELAQTGPRRPGSGGCGLLCKEPWSPASPAPRGAPDPRPHGPPWTAGALGPGSTQQWLLVFTHEVQSQSVFTFQGHPHQHGGCCLFNQWPLKINM